MRQRRNKKCKGNTKILNDEDEETKFEEDVEEVMRLGLYVKGDARLSLQQRKS